MNTKNKFSYQDKVGVIGVLISFLVSSMIPPQVYAQLVARPQTAAALSLPKPGEMVLLSEPHTPALLKGLKIHPENPLQFDFLIDTGESDLSNDQLEAESIRLIKYFLASLTVPEQDLWVNLSPYEQDRVIPEALSQTEMGRDLLAQDYLLKQLIASLMYPEKELGKEFWDKVYRKAQKQYGITNIPIDTFHKVWIMPQKAVVYTKGQVAFVVESRLKVMMEEDYVALEQSRNDSKFNVGRSELSVHATNDQNTLNFEHSTLNFQSGIANRIETEIIREIILPEIEREVNEGTHFAQLRQIFHSLILATWFKRNLKESFLGRVYVEENKVEGIDIEDQQVKEKVYQQYLKAFQQGVYNYIQEDYDPIRKQIIPRKYFSGGVRLAWEIDEFEEVQALPEGFQGPDGAMLSVVTNLTLVQERITRIDSAPKKDIQINRSEFLVGLSILLASPAVLEARMREFESKVFILSHRHSGLDDGQDRNRAHANLSSSLGNKLPTNMNPVRWLQWGRNDLIQLIEEKEDLIAYFIYMVEELRNTLRKSEHNIRHIGIEWPVELFHSERIYVQRFMSMLQSFNRSLKKHGLEELTDQQMRSLNLFTAQPLLYLYELEREVFENIELFFLETKKSLKQVQKQYRQYGWAPIVLAPEVQRMADRSLHELLQITDPIEQERMLERIVELFPEETNRRKVGRYLQVNLNVLRIERRNRVFAKQMPRDVRGDILLLTGGAHGRGLRENLAAQKRPHGVIEIIKVNFAGNVYYEKERERKPAQYIYAHIDHQEGRIRFEEANNPILSAAKDIPVVSLIFEKDPLPEQGRQRLLAVMRSEEWKASFLAVAEDLSYEQFLLHFEMQEIYPLKNNSAKVKGIFPSSFTNILFINEDILTSPNLINDQQIIDAFIASFRSRGIDVEKYENDTAMLSGRLRQFLGIGIVAMALAFSSDPLLGLEAKLIEPKDGEKELHLVLKEGEDFADVLAWVKDLYTRADLHLSEAYLGYLGRLIQKDNPGVEVEPGAAVNVFNVLNPVHEKLTLLNADQTTVFVPVRVNGQEVQMHFIYLTKDDFETLDFSATTYAGDVDSYINSRVFLRFLKNKGILTTEQELTEQTPEVEALIQQLTPQEASASIEVLNRIRDFNFRLFKGRSIRERLRIVVMDHIRHEKTHTVKIPLVASRTEEHPISQRIRRIYATEDMSTAQNELAGFLAEIIDSEEPKRLLIEAVGALLLPHGEYQQHAEALRILAKILFDKLDFFNYLVQTEIARLEEEERTTMDSNRRADIEQNVQARYEAGEYFSEGALVDRYSYYENFLDSLSNQEIIAEAEVEYARMFGALPAVVVNDEKLEEAIDLLISTGSLNDDSLQDPNNDLEKKEGTENALTSDVGGIDFNPQKFALETQGGHMPMNFPLENIPCLNQDQDGQCDDLNWQELENMTIHGLTPVIFKIVPIPNLPLFLGVADEGEKVPQLSQLD